jgi:hypothetical protein
MDSHFWRSNQPRIAGYKTGRFESSFLMYNRSPVHPYTRIWEAAWMNPAAMTN